MQDAKAVVAVGDERESAAGDHSNFYVVHFVHGVVRVEDLIEPRGFGIFDVENGEAVFSASDISIGAGNVDIASVVERGAASRDGLWMSEVGDVEGLQAVAVYDERAAELDSDAARIFEVGSADGGGDFRFERVVQIDDDEILVGKDVGEGSCDGDAAGAGEEAVGIEGEGALEEIVAGIAVEERADAGQLCPSIWGFEIGIANDDKALFAVRDVKKAVHHVDGLFFVFGKLLAKRIDAKSCR